MSRVRQQRFYKELLAPFSIVWPILSGILATMLGLGVVVAYVEGWQVLDGVYFAFVTGLTVGYGDLVPTHGISRVLAIGIGISGVLLTALFAAIAVRALQQAAQEAHPAKASPDRNR